MKVEYDEMYGQFVVWEISQAVKIEKFKDRSRKKCKTYIKKNSKKRKR